MGLMDLAKQAIDYVLHIDKHLLTLVAQYGTGIYLILFLIVFIETGFVLVPFLPGDSLMFIAGTIAGGGLLNYWILFPIFLAAAVLGDTLNYWIGHKFGEKVFEKSRLFKKEYLQRTEEFYAKHGGKTVFFARFIPIIRTFAPFVAGVGKMKYKKFLTYNIIGAFVWVTLFLTAGYFFGNLPIVKDNLVVVTLLIIIISFIPPIYEYLRYRKAKRSKKKYDAKKIVNKD